MKKIVFILVLFFTLSSIAASDTVYSVKGVVIDTKVENTYCKGFKEGYEDGYCYKDFSCIPPIAPLCPIKGINEENNYKGGYQRGFKIGLEMQNKN